MWHLDELQLTAPQQLALDEVLLLRADVAEQPTEYFRLWELAETTVIVGRGSRVDAEVNRPACRQDGVAILRRSSGGAAIVAGPGCLLYSVVLNTKARPELRTIESAHRFVLTQLAAGLEMAGCVAQLAGTSDLATGSGWQLKKISGNSLRLRRQSLLYHGTLLYDFDVQQVGRLLTMPPRQPDYRARREHADFIQNIKIDGLRLRQAISDAWRPLQPLGEWPERDVRRLAEQKYARLDWTERL